MVPMISATNNAYVNPFSIAYSDPEWRRIAAEGEYNSGHTVAVNLELLMKYRRYNVDAQRDFETYLAGLAEIDKADSAACIRVARVCMAGYETRAVRDLVHDADEDGGAVDRIL